MVDMLQWYSNEVLFPYSVFVSIRNGATRSFLSRSPMDRHLIDYHARNITIDKSRCYTGSSGTQAYFGMFIVKPLK